MSRRLFLATFFVAVLIGTLGFLYRVQRVEASGIIYIRADGSIDPLTAPISTLDNVTYTLTGNITSSSDGIIVERDNIIIDGDQYTVRGNYTSNGIGLVGKSNVTVKNTTITNFYYGIYLYDTNKTTLSGSDIIENNESGVVLYFSSDNSISGNNITKDEYGIYLDFSSDNSIVGNKITNNGEGIYLWYASNVGISGNDITANSEYGVWLDSSSNVSISGNSFVNDGLRVISSFGNVVSDNLVNGKPLVYLEGASDVVVGDAGQVVLVQCNRIRVENFNLSNATVGVELWQTNNTEISRNNITANSESGIYLDSSSNDTISGNNITANNQFGIYFASSSDNSVSGNNIRANSLGGIYLYSSANNSVSGNNIRANSLGGIYLYSSANNSVSGNNITANKGTGIALDFACFYNSISRNNIANNEGGISLWFYSSDNKFYHNSFINNTNQVYLHSSSANVWDDGYPNGGNYWSDYNGTDANHDGIGDTAYTIDGNNTDHYPLITQYVIPEFPIFFILPLFMIATLSAVIAYRRKTRVSDVL